MKTAELSLLESYGIAPAEFDILAAVDLRGNMARNCVADNAALTCSGRPDPTFTQADYEAATEACLNKGWLKHLTTEDCDLDHSQWHQYVGEVEYTEGYVDFTSEGANLYYEILAEKAVAEGKKPYHQVIRYSWKMPGQVQVFGSYEDEVRRRVNAIERGEEEIASEPLLIERVEEPVPVGEWWINRFVRMLQGYRVDIYYADAPFDAENGEEAGQ